MMYFLLPDRLVHRLRASDSSIEPKRCSQNDRDCLTTDDTPTGSTRLSAMVGRRLSDGAVVAEPASDQLRWIVSSVLLLVAAGSCPSHDSFTAYLGAMAQHPSDLLGGLSAIVESVHIAVAATSSSWLVLRIGRFRSDPYLGVFGTWFPLPSLDVPWPSFDVRWPSSLTTDPWGMVCSGGRSPHESFVLLCLLGFAMWRLVPRAMHRHAVCSLRAVQEGRVWVLLSANVSHASVLHLLHNALQLMHFGPILHASLGWAARDVPNVPRPGSPIGGRIS